MNRAENRDAVASHHDLKRRSSPRLYALACPYYYNPLNPSTFFIQTCIMVGKVLYKTRESDLNRRRLHLTAICMPPVLSPTILAKKELSHLFNLLNVQKRQNRQSGAYAFVQHIRSYGVSNFCSRVVVRRRFNQPVFVGRLLGKLGKW